ncbi:hypothetical protein ILUMI_22371 [Ignelater luminosus]|uniref:B30.2/SPRY domain-containing protein n=1 Tax=Ignelater luminosus TaxID=2038154 RepID=A0A8K0FXF3_IGNLU|nr:hypothetical protein ILUMI_22371 [Ignelater luminosus]
MFTHFPPRSAEAKHSFEMIQLVKSLSPPLDHQINNYNWNKEDSSPNIYVDPGNESTFCKLCEEPSTDCIRGKHSFESGIHAWRITWNPSHRGMYSIVGVATAEAPLHELGEKILVGSSRASWGWDLNTNLLYHNSSNDSTGKKYPGFIKDDARIIVPEDITVLLNMEEGTLAYIINKFYLGIAFHDLKGLKLFPIVNVTKHDARVTLEYLGGLTSEEVRDSALRTAAGIALLLSTVSVISVENRPLRSTERAQLNTNSKLHLNEGRRKGRVGLQVIIINIAFIDFLYLQIDLLENLARPPPFLLEIFSWNKNDCSPNITVQENNEFVLYKDFNGSTTDCVRGKYGFDSGINAWKISWKPSQRGPYPIVGVATIDSPLHAMGVKMLVGNNNTSWGWDIDMNLLHHNTTPNQGILYPRFMIKGTNMSVSEDLILMLNMEEGTLSYFANGYYLGVAFDDLKGKKLYPVVNVTSQRCKIEMTYLGGLL